MPKKKELTVVCFTGPSFSGKSTLSNYLKEKFPGMLAESISHYTRKPREGEVDGVHYNFTDRDFFEKHKDNFIETAVFNGEICGTHVENLVAAYKEDKTLVLVLEDKGALALNKINHLEIDGDLVQVNTKQVYLDISPVAIQQVFLEELKDLEKNGASREELNDKISDFNKRIERDNNSRNPNDVKAVKEISNVVRTGFKELDDVQDIVNLFPSEVQEALKEDIFLQKKNKAIKQLVSRGVSAYMDEDWAVHVQPIENDFLTVQISKEEINYRAEQYDLEQHESECIRSALNGPSENENQASLSPKG